MRIVSLAAALAVIAAPAVAGPLDEVRGGVYLQGLGPFSPNKEEGVGLNAELLFNRLEALKFIGAPQPHVGVTAATGDLATSVIYAGLLWEYDFTERIFINGGFGLAIHDGETRFTPPDPLANDRSYLGCRALFRLSADLGVRLTDRFSAMIHTDHMSNADLCSENEGLDNTGLRFGYDF
jgi:lipid A 3-O-deacylase